MKNKYVSFVSDEHLLECINNLYNSYIKAKEKVSKEKFYNNKIDVFKMMFDSKLNNLTYQEVIKSETFRQIDKSINNSIGIFHEEVLGGVNGFEKGIQSGYDIKAEDNTLFADIKNKHNTMNSSSAESLFQKLASLADNNKKAKCYWVQMLAKQSFIEPWVGDINGKEYSHSRVFKISGDKFYELITKEENALFNLYKALPVAINDFLRTQKVNNDSTENSVLTEIEKSAKKDKRSIIDQITYENYSYYLGFDKL